MSDKASEQAEHKLYADIYDAVMEHRLPPQTKLTEQVLCDLYGLARHNVRKVLGRLAADGLVELSPNRGAFIANPTAQEAQEMFELRQTLERLVVQKVAQKLEETHNPRDLAGLQDLVARERAAWQSGDRASWIRLSADFHLALAALAGNGLLSDILRRLVSRTTLLIAGTDTSGQNSCSFDEHQHILDLLAAGNKPAALRSMATHLQACAHRSTLPQETRFDLRSALNRV